VSGVLQIPPHRLRMKQRAEQAQWRHQRPLYLDAITDVCLRQPAVVHSASQPVSLGGATLSNYT
jgi:hypothetical protein